MSKLSFRRLRNQYINPDQKLAATQSYLRLFHKISSFSVQNFCIRELSNIFVYSQQFEVRPCEYSLLFYVTRILVHRAAPKAQQIFLANHVTAM